MVDSAGSAFERGPQFPTRTPNVDDHRGLGFRAILKLLHLQSRCRVLDVGAGGFVGASTTEHLIDILDAEIDGVERNPEKAAKLAERFGSRVRVHATSFEDYTWPQEPYDLIVFDLDSGLIPTMIREFVPAAEPHLRLGGYFILVFIYSLAQIYDVDPPQLSISGRAAQADFMMRTYDSTQLTTGIVQQAYDGSTLTVCGIVDKYMAAEDRKGMGWLVLQKTG